MTHYTLVNHDMDWSKVQDGDTIDVMLEGKIYVTEVQHGVQRFKINTVLQYMFEHDNTGRAINMHDGRDIHNNMLNLNTLSVAYQRGEFDKRDYCEIVMQGYSVSGFCDLGAFRDWTIQNPVWSDTKPNLICAENGEEDLVHS